MKTIYLTDKNYELIPYQYKEIDELKKELENRNIKLGDCCTLGDDCVLGDLCTLGNFCTLGDRCTLGYRCTLGEYCTLGNFCTLGDLCTLGNFFTLGDRCTLGNFCTLGDRCTLGEYCTLGDRCTLDSNVDLINSIYINGSRYPLTYVGNNKISIGCKCYTIEKWRNAGLEIAKNEGYTEEQIKEYEKYIDTIESFIKIKSNNK